MSSQHIIGVLADLFFMVKISDAAKQAGMTVEYVKDPKGVLDKAKAKPAIIIFDLNFEAAGPVELIAKLKSNPEFNGIDLIGFLSHVQEELKRKAQEAGCDTVLARSAFSQNLPLILKRYSGSV
ncbi:MAG: response regulator [Bryobacteraceae bacterium]